MNSDLEEHLATPKLRQPIDVSFEQLSEGPVILVRCPIGVSPAPLGLIPQVAPILQRFDGTKSVETIHQELSAQGATPEIIVQLAKMLDDALFLDGPKFQGAFDQMKRSFIDAPVRPAAMAGHAYPADGEMLAKEITGYLSLGSSNANLLQAKPLRALMTPHIDYQRGQRCYGKSFVALEEQHPDLILLIGTSHQYSPHLFHLTEKDFASPLSTLKNSKPFTSALAEHYGKERAYADELLHKREHSLELQVPFLSHLSPGSQIVPVLVGGFHDLVTTGKNPTDHEPYERFVEALLETIEQEVTGSGRSLCIVAGVDMAHIGRFFGDDGSLSQEQMQQIQVRDEAYIDCLQRQDHEELFTHIAEDGDARRVCGFPTMYTVLDLFNRLGWKGDNQLLDYRQAVNWQADCAVTFAGMAFYE